MVGCPEFPGCELFDAQAIPAREAQGMPRLFQINEDDLAALEKAVPQLVDALTPTLDNRLRVYVRQVRRIITDVRWNYGPPTDVETIPAEGDQAL